MPANFHGVRSKGQKVIESVEKSSVKEVAGTDVLSKGKENNDGIELLENEGISNIQSTTPLPSSSGMTSV